MRYTAYGFPFGGMIDPSGQGARGPANPSISVTGGSVAGGCDATTWASSSRSSSTGRLQPGNSGGPIVDERGRLLGVAVAKLAAADTIGLAIPAAELRELLDGRVGRLGLSLRPARPGRPTSRSAPRSSTPTTGSRGSRS